MIFIYKLHNNTSSCYEYTNFYVEFIFIDYTASPPSKF